MRKRSSGVTRLFFCVSVAGTISLVSIWAQAGAWTTPPGKLWLKTSFSFWQAHRKFASTLDAQSNFQGRGAIRAGDRVPFDPLSSGGVFRALGVTTNIRLGLLRWLDIGVSLPVLWSDFDVEPDDTVSGSVGLGDALFSVKAAERIEAVTIGGRVLLKIPTGDFDPSVLSVPLTEGQIDIAFISSAGLSLYPYGYANVELGARIRLADSASGRDPGEEFLFAVEGGVNLPYNLMVRLIVDGLIGTEGTLSLFGGESILPHRELYSLWTGLYWMPREALSIGASARFLIAGQDFPTGVQWMFGAAYTFDLWGSESSP